MSNSNVPRSTLSRLIGFFSGGVIREVSPTGSTLVSKLSNWAQSAIPGHKIAGALAGVGVAVCVGTAAFATYASGNRIEEAAMERMADRALGLIHHAFEIGDAWDDIHYAEETKRGYTQRVLVNGENDLVPGTQRAVDRTTLRFSYTNSSLDGPFGGVFDIPDRGPAMVVVYNASTTVSVPSNLIEKIQGQANEMRTRFGFGLVALFADGKLSPITCAVTGRVLDTEAYKVISSERPALAALGVYRMSKDVGPSDSFFLPGAFRSFLLPGTDVVYDAARTEQLKFTSPPDFNLIDNLIDPASLPGPGNPG